MERINHVSGLEFENVNDFGFINIMDETNFESFIEHNFECDQIVGCLADQTQFLTTPEDHLFDFNGLCEFNSIPEGRNVAEQENDGEEEEESSGTTTTATTTTTTPTKRGKKTDRSRTLISERKRRGRMKEKLYALRSLVPNITKMDKASIIGDAVLYVQGLQMQAKKLKAEISSLESSFNRPNNYPGGSFQNAKKMNITTNPPVIKNILQMEVFQVDGREFYVRMVCNKGQGIAALLYKALEYLANFKVHSSNLATAAENYVFTFTLNVNEFEVDINLPNLKIWIASAFLNQGFDFVTLPSV